ncbi:formylglycine-generating enzyme family protein [bacterium]|nr:formylglycine-generating enzyme family protein [bacterium]
MKFLSIVLAVLPLLAASLHAAWPEVSNLAASQRAGTTLVDITYDVSADTPTVTISLEVSSDGGATFTVPATSLSGAIGVDVAVGAGKTITWDAGADWNQQSSSTMRFKVVADDGLPGPEFIEVAAGSLPQSSWAGAQAVDAFYMAKTEVIWAHFQEVRTWAGANGYDIGDVGAGTGSNHPVTNVTWYQAVKWCNAWSEKEGLDPVYKTNNGAVYRSGDTYPSVLSTANGYRLPSEKEWEFAARGGVQTKGYEYSGSNDVNAVSWYNGNSNSTQDVATKQANELGIHDMSGNVWEWCFEVKPGGNRVIRGCSHGNRANGCGIAEDRRDFINPGYSSNLNGFRVARSSVP